MIALKPKKACWCGWGAQKTGWALGSGGDSGIAGTGSADR